MTSNKKTASAAATAKTASESLGKGTTNSNSTRPALTAWNQAVDGLTIREAPDVQELRWGADFMDTPDWAQKISDTGTLFSLPVSIRAQQYDDQRPCPDGKLRTVEGRVRVTVTQAPEHYYPSIALDLRKLGRDGEGRRASVTAAQIRLYPHEVQPLIEALNAARDLVDGEGK